jgi:hypothetical protein
LSLRTPLEPVRSRHVDADAVPSLERIGQVQIRVVEAAPFVGLERRIAARWGPLPTVPKRGEEPLLHDGPATVIGEVPAAEVPIGVEQPSVVVGAAQDEPRVRLTDGDRFLVLREADVVAVEKVSIRSLAARRLQVLDRVRLQTPQRLKSAAHVRWSQLRMCEVVAQLYHP